MHILFYIYHAPAIVLAVTLLIVTHLVQVTAKLFALVLRRSSRNLVLRVLSELIKRRGASRINPRAIRNVNQRCRVSETRFAVPIFHERYIDSNLNITKKRPSPAASTNSRS